MTSRVEFQQEARSRLAAGLLLTAMGGIFFSWSATAANVQARGFDFRETPTRIIGIVLGLVPVVIGIDYLVRLIRNVPDVVVDGEGLLVRRLFFQRDQYARWTEVTRMEATEMFAGFKTLPVLKVFGSGKPLRVVLDRFEAPPERVQAAITDAWATGSSASEP